jgi:acid phosphatase type 7
VGYYSYDLGDWHIVALNSSCVAVLGCEVGSLQEQWLRRDLAAHPTACTLAYWHQPRFSSGGHGDDAAFQPLWQALQDYHADVVLTGHDHDYERFRPERADGVADPNGVREFVVGTGGENLDPFRTIRAGSVVRDNADFGVLKMKLEKSSYTWQFISTNGGVVKDSGSALCVTDAAGKSVIKPQATPQPTPGN